MNMNTIAESRTRLSAAWRLLSGRLASGMDPAALEAAVVWIPAVGAAAGIVTGVAAVLCVHIVRGQMAAAALIAAIVLPWAWWIHNRGLFLASSAQVLSELLPRSDDPGNAGAPTVPWLPLLATENLILVKCAATAVLVGMGAPLWVGLGPAIGSAVAADGMLPTEQADSTPEKEDTERSQIPARTLGTLRVWAAPIIAAVVLTWPMGLILEGVAGVCVGGWLSRIIRTWLATRRSCDDLTAARAVAEWTEILVLLIGVVLATRMFT